MSGCGCGRPDSLLIEASFLRVDGETCERCNSTSTAARDAAERLKGVLGPMGVEVVLREYALEMDELDSSNTLRINGRPLEDWLGAERVSTECASCGDLCGYDSVCCSALELEGEVHESPSVDLIMQAALKATGIFGGGGSCC